MLQSGWNQNNSANKIWPKLLHSDIKDYQKYLVAGEVTKQQLPPVVATIKVGTSY